MKELSLNILDIAENSLKAGALLTKIEIAEDETTLSLTITDDGTGMSEEILKSVENPFYTTRTTRKVGMGIPLLKLEAEQTGGSFKISSNYIETDPVNHGTQVCAVFYKKHIDFTPLGDVASTLITLIQGHPNRDFLYNHTYKNKSVVLDTREIKSQIEEIPINTFEVLEWIKQFVEEQYSVLYK